MAQKNIVKDVAQLACLEIPEQDLAQYQTHFDQIIKYFGDLEELDTTGIEPMVTPHQIFPELRPDQAKRDLSIDEVMENAPDVKDGQFRVPPVV